MFPGPGPNRPGRLTTPDGPLYHTCHPVSRGDAEAGMAGRACLVP